METITLYLGTVSLLHDNVWIEAFKALTDKKYPETIKVDFEISNIFHKYACHEIAGQVITYCYNEHVAIPPYEMLIVQINKVLDKMRIAEVSEVMNI